MPGNPRTYPDRFPGDVDAEVRHSEAQRASLEAMTVASGQGDALYLSPLEAEPSGQRGAYTSITWFEGRLCVLQQADVVVLFELPTAIDAPPVTTRVRWDVAARIAGAQCWQSIAGLEPPRLITRRWPSVTQLDAMKALALPERG